MPVEKTASPKVSPSAPNDSPRKVRPSSRTMIAGAGRAMPYLLLRLTGRIVKGCSSRRRHYQRTGRRRASPDACRDASGPSGPRRAHDLVRRPRAVLVVGHEVAHDQLRPTVDDLQLDLPVP